MCSATLLSEEPIREKMCLPVLNDLGARYLKLFYHHFTVKTNEELWESQEK